MSSEIVLDFVKYINEHDVKKISELMAPDHTFTDAHNNSITGRDNMMQGWRGYFSMFPDYKLEVDEFYEAGSTFVMMGFASGTYKGLNPEQNHWKLPAAWKAIVEEDKIKHWQVYCDTRVPLEIIEKNT
jgi:ketosteroid isomerase-like protein